MKAKIIIIGSGFGGLATAKKLLDEGETDFHILERADDVGGVWRDNVYPGAGCDVQSHLYSFSYDLNPHWTRDYSLQGEILEYLRDSAKRWGLLPKIRMNEDVRKLRWLEQEGEWEVTTAERVYFAKFVVGAFGNLSDPAIPNITGLDTFEGEVVHSANWSQGFCHKDKRVAVIGTGASAIQFVPAIQPDVKQMSVFQRTPPWILPRDDNPIPQKQRSRYASTKWRMQAERLRLYLTREVNVLGFLFPKLMERAERQARKHLEASIQDPVLRAKLTPDYRIGCKRVLLSNVWYPALTQDNVEVVTSGIASIEKNAVVDSNGRRREVDAIILGTGFQAKDLPFAKFIYGKDGQTLSEVWGDNPKSLVGTSIVGFPNFFLLHGPNTALGHTSGVYILEAQAEHAISGILYATRKKKPIIEPTQKAQDRFTSWIKRRSKGTVWTSGGCESWYLDNSGQNSSLWPSFTFSYRMRASKIRRKEYHLRDTPAQVSLVETR